MGKFYTTVKWGVKLGVVGGATYAASTERLFGTASDSERAFEKAKSLITSNEYYQMLPSKEDIVPKEVGEQTAKANEHWNALPRYWNSGVLYAFDKLAKAPETLTSYALELQTQISSPANQENLKKEEKTVNEKQKD